MVELQEVVSASLIRTWPCVFLSSELAIDGVKESITTQESAINRALKLKHKKDNSNELAANGDCLEPCRKVMKGDCSERFAFKVMPDQLSKLKEGVCLANTLKNNTWALKTFEEWWVTRNNRYPLALRISL